MIARVDRMESKFLISLEMRDRLISEIEGYTGYDETAGGTSCYPIISQYYDNQHRDCYWEKQRKQKSRRKLRIRVYGSDAGKVPPTTFIEVKHKHYGRGSKRRLRLPMDDALELAAGNKERMLLDGGEMSRYERMVVQEIVDMVRNREFGFLCTMRYDRQAFVGGDDAPDLRITFDTGIACRFEELDLCADDKRFEHYLLPDDRCIMEVKTNDGVPHWVRSLVGKHGLVRRGFSKFCTALEEHDPVTRRALGKDPAISDNLQSFTEMNTPAMQA